MTKPVTLATPIEELVREFPESVGFLTRYGIRCLRCGEPFWCTLGELLEAEGISEPEKLLASLNAFLAEPKNA